MSYRIEINGNWCKKCGLCAYFCPKKVFDVDVFGSPSAAQPDNCTGCLQCEYRCPDFALGVVKIDK